METEAKATTVAVETPKETQDQPATDISKLESMIQALNDRFDKYEKDRLSTDEIRKIAEKNVIEAKVKEEEESIKLERRAADWEKRKTKLDIRNEMWEQMTRDFINEEIPRTHIRAGMMEEGWKGGIGQMLSLALFRYLAPNNGVSINDLNGISLLAGEKAFKARNNGRSVITMHGK